MDSETNFKDFIDIVRFTKCLSLSPEKTMLNLTDEFFIVFRLALSYYSEKEEEFIDNKKKLLIQLWKLITKIEIALHKDARSLLLKSKKRLESTCLTLTFIFSFLSNLRRRLPVSFQQNKLIKLNPEKSKS